MVHRRRNGIPASAPLTRRAFAGLAATAALRAAAPKPNIVFILADDLGYGDLGCYGQRKIRTPHLDRMAAQGMRFTQAYAGSTVCAPSRCSLMTGKHNGHGRVRDNVPQGIFLQPDDATVAETLKQAGYRTGAVGKWSLGNPGSWGLPNMQGFDEFFGYLDQDHAHNYYPELLWENDHEVLLPGNRANRRSVYSPDLFARRATSFLESNRSRPFFLYFAPTLPHWSDYPKTTPRSQDIPSDAPYTGEDWPQVEKNYAAMVTLLDRQAGDILELLGRLSIEERTLVLFASDNGPSAESLHKPAFFQSGGPFRGVKRDLYEGGIRVPLLAQWRGSIAAGSVNDTVCAFWDFLPTAAEIAGLPAPEATDGISLLPAFQGRPRRSREYLYWDYGHCRGAFLQAVRRGDWKAVRKGSHAPTELYDLAADAAEAHDAAAAHPQLAAELTRLMDTALVPSPDYPIRDRAEKAVVK